MNDDKCKICNLTITNYDEVKVCPNCGECYHKSCFENFGCVNKDCKKANEDINKCGKCGNELPENALFCPNCGKHIENKKNVCKHCGSEIESNSNYCTVCGFNVNTSEDIGLENNQSQDQDTDLNDFIGEKAPYYKGVFKEMDITKKKTSWNWCACLFGSTWFIYRKMWLPAIIYVLITSSLTILNSYGLMPEAIMLAVEVALFVASGLFGNYLYMRYVNKHIDIAKNFDEDQKFYYYKRKGGTSVALIFLFMFIVLIVNGYFGI